MKRHIARHSRRYLVESLENRRLLSTVPLTIGENFAGINSGSTGSNPPDTMGAVGPDHVAEIINGRYRVWDKYGTQLDDRSLTSFWNNASVTPVGSAYDPRLEYDAGVDRWYAVSLDNGGSDNAFLFAISNDSNPLNGWTGFRIDSDAGTGNRWADFPSIGYDNDGVYISANMIDIAGVGSNLAVEVNILVLPKADLLLATPSTANRTLIEDVIATTGRWVVPITYQDPSETESAFPPRMVSADEDSFNFSALGGTINAPTVVAAADVPVSFHNEFLLARQPDGTTDLDTKGLKMRSHVIAQNGDFWAVQEVEGSFSNGAIRFVRIENAGLTLQQEVIFQNSSADFLYPSIAVNSDEEVVIGYTHTGPDAGEFPSSAAVLGTSSGGVTTFPSGIFLTHGTTSYHVFDSNGFNRWGDYSQTVLDPSAPGRFWTFQEVATGSTSWSTQITELSVSGLLPAKLGLTRTTAQAFAVPHGPTGLSHDALSLNAYINSQGDIDSYYFGGDSVIGADFTIEVGDFGSATTDPAFAVYNATTGAMVVFDTDSGAGDTALASFTGTVNTRYILAVADENGGTGDYEVTITYGNTTSGVNIPIDATGFGATAVSLGVDVDPDFYHFTTPADALGTGTIQFDPLPSDLDGAIWLFDAAGNTIESSFVAGPGALDIITVSGLLASTEYYLTMQSRDYATHGDGAIAISLDAVPGPLGLTYTGVVQNQLVPAVPTEDALDSYFGDAFINSAGEIDAFYIAEGPVGGATWTFTTDDGGSAALDLVVAVYNADTGVLLGFDDDSGPGDNASAMGVTSANTRYIVAVADKLGGTGDITLRVDQGPGVAGIDVPLDQGSGATFVPLLTNTILGAYRFTTPAFVTGNATVAITPNAGSPTLDTLILVTDAAGNKLGSRRLNNPGLADSVNLTGLAANTTYYITVGSYNYASSGVATLSITVAIPVPAVPAAPNLIAASDSGASPTDDITNDNTPTFTGTADPNSTVHLYANNVEVGSTTANGAGNWSITTSTVADGNYTVRARADFGGALSAASAPLSPVVIDTAPPVLIGTGQFLYDTVHALQFRFSDNVVATLGVGDIVVTNTDVSANVPNPAKSLAYNGANNQATLTFPGLPSARLPNGNYEARISAGSTTDIAGNVQAADLTLPFFFLLGDANHDAVVDIKDLYILATNWNQSGRVFSQGDFSYNGVVDAVDLGILSANWQRRPDGSLLAGAALPSLPNLPPPMTTIAPLRPVRRATRVVDPGVDTTDPIVA